MELITRLVYIDTSAYERKHFQFGLYILEKLENFASHDKVNRHGFNRHLRVI